MKKNLKTIMAKYKNIFSKDWQAPHHEVFEKDCSDVQDIFFENFFPYLSLSDRDKNDLNVY